MNSINICILLCFFLLLITSLSQKGVIKSPTVNSRGGGMKLKNSMSLVISGTLHGGKVHTVFDITYERQPKQIYVQCISMYIEVIKGRLLTLKQ